VIDDSGSGLAKWSVFADAASCGLARREVIVTQHVRVSTASGGVVIERKHSAEGATYEESAVMQVGGAGEVAGEAEPMLADPIDYEAELAERRETHEPIEFDPDTDLTNSQFGI
jgi:hypothetical protein